MCDHYTSPFLTENNTTGIEETERVSHIIQGVTKNMRLGRQLFIQIFNRVLVYLQVRIY